MKNTDETRQDMNAIENRNFSNEYRTVPVAELTESTTNPRKAFDEERLDELAASIRSHGVLSPLVVRHVNGHFEIVAGARRYRAAQRARLAELPVRVLALTDAEAQELQIIENVQRSDVHPFEEAQGFRALLDREGGSYTIEKIAAAIAKPATYVAKRLKLLDLIEPAAQAFVARHIGLEHALLIAKVTPDTQEQALAHCFDGYFAGNEAERSLVPASRLQEWIAHNVYLGLKSVPFSKDDETLVPETGSCANCPKRTGFNTLLFSDEHSEDACSDASCFNRKLDAHIAQRVSKMPNLVLISEQYTIAGETPILPRRNYVEVIARKTKRGNVARPEQRLCNHLVAAIHADGMDKGRLVKICTTGACPIHFRERQQEEKQQLRWKAEKKAANQKAKQTLSFRHRLLSEVLKRVKPQFGCEELRLVVRFVLQSLPHELACRLGKRSGLNPKEAGDWEMAQEARTLHKKGDAAELAVLLFEAMLLGSASSPTADKSDDLLADAAALYKIHVKALRATVAKDDKAKAQKKGAKPAGKRARR